MSTLIDRRQLALTGATLQHLPANAFPTIHPIHWLTSHFAVGGSSPLKRLSGMVTAHMTRIAPHSGFTWHPHWGLEIYTWVLEGTLHHEDTTGGRGDIGRGELQRMFSGGNGIYHQELNRSDDPVRVIQIWYAARPEFQAIDPHYQQLRRTDLPRVRSGDADVMTLIGDGSPVEHHVDARLTAGVVDAGGATSLASAGDGEDLFLYVTDGVGSVHGEECEAPLGQYDVLLGRPGAHATIHAAPSQTLEYLAFYLPPFLDAA